MAAWSSTIPLKLPRFRRRRVRAEKKPSTAFSHEAEVGVKWKVQRGRARRLAWFEAQPDLDPERLIFIDETWASTAMTRNHGRAPAGERLRAGIPYGHWKTTTFVAGLRQSGMVAPCVLDGPINRQAFEAYVDQMLIPGLEHHPIKTDRVVL